MLLAALLLVPASSRRGLAQQTSSSPRELSSSYAVSWNGATVAGVKLQQGCPNTKAITSHALIASSTGLADDLHSFAIRLDTFLLASASSYPLLARTKITEEGRTRSFRSKFSSKEVTVDATIFGTKKASQTHTLPRKSHDLLSWILDLRGDLEQDASLSSRTYLVWDGWKLVEISARKRKHRQTISTPHASYEDAHVFSLTRTRIDLDDGSRKGDAEDLGTLWFSDSASPRLVAMDFESRVGTASVRLLDHKSSACP